MAVGSVGSLDLSWRVRIVLFGPLEVKLDGEPLSVAGPKRRALLARLAISSGEVVPAELLLHDVWAGRPPAAGLTTLQSHVAHLRRDLGAAEAAVATVSRGYVLRLDEAAVDTAVFSRAVEKARAHAQPEARASEVESALRLWRGRPLLEFEGEEWADTVGRQLEQLRLEAEDLRADAELRLGRYAALVPRMEVLTDAHPLHERFWLHLMAALRGCGRHGEALRAGQQLRAVLAEIGLTPSPEFEGLEARILRHLPNDDDHDQRVSGRRWSAARSNVLSGHVGRSDTVALVGRDREVRALRSAAERIERDGQQAVLVAGEAGVGKSRLVRSVAALVRERGSLVLEGRCDDGLAVPFQPFVEALSGFLVRGEEVGDAGQRRSAGLAEASICLGDQPEELARMVPVIRSVVLDLPPAPPADPDLAQHRFCRAIDSWLSAVSARQPVLLVVEDLHWATRPTLMLLRHILESPSRRPLLVVASYRDTEPWRAVGWAGWLAEVRRRPDLVSIDLQGLDEDAITLLVEQARAETASDARTRRAGPSSASGPLAAEVHQLTRGNALLVVELLRHLREAGHLGHEGTTSASGRAMLRRLGVPAGVRLLVRDRLERLDGDAADTLARAAVLGAEVDARVLRASSPVDDRRLVAALDLLVAARFLEPGEAGTYLYRFPHALVREAVLYDLSDLRLTLLHRDAGTAIEIVHAGQLDQHVDALATHFRLAAPVAGAAPALEYGIKAGHRALREGAADDSLAHFAATLALIDAAPFADDAVRCEVLLGLGEAQRRVEPGRHRQTFLDAAAIALRSGDVDRLARAAKGISRGFLAIVEAPDPERTDLITSALHALGRDPSEQRALLLASLAGEARFAHDVDGSRALVAEAVDVAREVSSDALLIRALATQWDVLFHPHTLDHREVIVAELCGLAERCADPHLRLRVALTEFTVGLERGDRPTVERAVEEIRGLGRGHLPPASMWIVPLVGATWALVRGDLNEAETLAGRAHELGGTESSAAAEVVFRAQMFQIRACQGRLAEFDDAVRSIVGLVPAAGAAYAYLCAAAGRQDAALAEVDRLVGDGTRPLTPDATWPFALGLLAETVARLGDDVRAGALADLLVPVQEQNLAHFSYFLGPAAWLIGLLRKAQGELAEATTWLARAERSAHALGAVRYERRARCEREALGSY